MIEEVILEFLREKMSVSVYMEEPEEEEDQYVLIEKTGSSCQDHIYSATFAVQSYAKSLYEAAILNEEVKAAMDDLINLNKISRSKLNTDYNFTDTETKRYRYQAVYDIYY